MGPSDLPVYTSVRMFVPQKYKAEFEANFEECFLP